MSEQPTLWDFAQTQQVEDPSPGPDEATSRDMRKARKETFQKLRASGHWRTVVRVAYTLDSPFTLNDLSIACHRAEPAFFGMKGYPHHPDNHKIHTFLYGKRGLIHHGLIERVRKGMFQMPAELPFPFRDAYRDGSS
jgi:hypothetical protein